MAMKPTFRFLHVILLASALLLLACSAKNNNQTELNQASYVLGGVGSFGELVNSGVKKLALSAALPSADMDKIMEEAQRVAERNHVQLYREKEFLITDLFPESETTGKDVLLIYQGTTKEEYLQLKEDKKQLIAAGQYTGKSREEIARRFGRMLSYPAHRINELLAANTSFRTMENFGIRATNLFLYYKDLNRAADFYGKTLGMEQVTDYSMARIFRMTASSYLILVDATKGMHTAEEPKTVALALITDQLDEWYAYLKTTDTKIKYDYSPRPGRPHNGFVITDPEGYLLEFETFLPHAENETFLPQLKSLTALPSAATVPTGLGFKATITWLYYKDMVNMERFYQTTLGLKPVADQGWAKIYRSSGSGYVGLVDERRGMHSFTEKKAVNVSFILNDLDGWFEYAKSNALFELREDRVSDGPEKKYRAFVGYDPEGYFMEFDIFNDHADNVALMKALRGEK